MLRDFRNEDRQDFIRLSNAFYRSEAVLHEVPRENFHSTFDVIMENSPFIRGLMFEREGETAGFALLCFTYSNEAGGLVVWLEEAYILPEFQGKGLGTELFQFVETEYGDKARRLRLEITPGNVNAKRLYERMGFEPLDYAQMIKEL